jgi:hypothetical protein
MKETGLKTGNMQSIKAQVIGQWFAALSVYAKDELATYIVTRYNQYYKIDQSSSQFKMQWKTPVSCLSEILSICSEDQAITVGHLIANAAREYIDDIEEFTEFYSETMNKKKLKKLSGNTTQEKLFELYSDQQFTKSTWFNIYDDIIDDGSLPTHEVYEELKAQVLRDGKRNVGNYKKINAFFQRIKNIFKK